MGLREHAQSEVLAEPDWLWERRDDPNLRIIDCGNPAAYDRAHIPGAVGSCAKRTPSRLGPHNGSKSSMILSMF